MPLRHAPPCRPVRAGLPRCLPLLILLPLLTLPAGGCTSEGAAGWTPLWEDSREELAADDLWLRGVRLDRPRTVEVEGPGTSLFRARLVHAAPAAGSPGGEAEITLEGPSGTRRWTLAPREDRSVQVEVEPGRHRLSGPPEVLVGEPRLGRPLDHPRLVVVLLADTLRADHVTPDLTPHISDAFAAGRRWNDVTANAAWTLPSVASLFTSRPMLDLSLPEGGLIGVPEGVPTWAERLAEAGFSGGAAVTNYTVHTQNGFARGFSSYRVPSPKGRTAPPDASWVIAEGRRFLDDHRGEDAFLYLHFMDPHEPFRDHGAGLPAPPSMATLSHRRRAATEAEADLLRTLYRGEARHLDGALGPFLEALPDHAIVAFTADHGEALGEHGGVWGHGLTLYQEVVSVPLLLRGPGIDPGTVETPVQLLDLMPTLLGTVGVEPAPGMAGRSLLSSREGDRHATPLVTATFSAGPLRWAWREQDRKIVLRTAPQSAGAPDRRKILEDDPLPAGAWVRHIESSPTEARGAPIPSDSVPEVARVFAHTAGSLVPGPTLLIVGAEGPAEVAFECAAELEPLHLWGTSAVEVERDGDRWTVRTTAGAPLAGVAFRAELPAGGPVDVVPLDPLEGALPWPGRRPGRSFRAEAGPPPRIDRPGVYLWWNDPRSVEIAGQEETEERLHALGYL